MTVGDCKMEFPIATRIPSFENSFRIKLPDSIITVDVKHRQTTTSEQIQNRERRTDPAGSKLTKPNSGKSS
jgi:hypothetical protein